MIIWKTEFHGIFIYNKKKCAYIFKIKAQNIFLKNMIYTIYALYIYVFCTLVKFFYVICSYLYFLAVNYKVLLDCAFHEYYYLKIYAFKCLNVKMLFFFSLQFFFQKNLFSIKMLYPFWIFLTFMYEYSTTSIYLEYNSDFKTMTFYQYFKCVCIFDCKSICNETTMSFENEL